MAVLKIPPAERRQWRGIFPSEYEGDFSGCWNIDPKRIPGKLCLSGPGTIALKSDSATSAYFKSPIHKFLTSDVDGSKRIWGFSKYQIVHNSGGLPIVSWAADTTTNTPVYTTDTANFIRDAITHGDSDLSDTASGDRILVALSSTIIALGSGPDPTSRAQWDTNWLDTPDTASGGPTVGDTYFDDTSGDHIFGKVQSLVIVTDDESFHTIDKSDVVTRNKIKFPLGYTAICVYTSKDTFWLGLQRTAGGDGLIISWDGSADEYVDYRIQGTPISGWVKDGIPYFINEFGQILGRINGYDFEEIAHFPIYEEQLLLTTSGTLSPAITGVSDIYGVHRNGCIVDGDLVRITLMAPSLSRRMRSGIWVFDTKTKDLYHENSFSENTGTPSIDYGQPVIATPGAAFNIRYGQPGFRLLASAEHYTSYDTNDVKSVTIQYFGQNVDPNSVGNRGYFVSPLIPAADVNDFFQKLWLTFRKFQTTGNKIVVKYRTVAPLKSATLSRIVQPSAVRWITDTSFRANTPNSLPAIVAVGYEVEVMAGRNAGCSFHISAINDTAGVALTPTDTTTAIVSIDEAAPSGDTFGSLVRFENWVKVEAFSDTSVDFHDFSLPGADSDGIPLNVGSDVQFKVELRGTMMEVDGYEVVSKPSLAAE